jgi:hypothetical protein
MMSFPWSQVDAREGQAATKKHFASRMQRIGATPVERFAMEMRVESHFSQADSSAVVPNRRQSRRLGKANAAMIP